MSDTTQNGNDLNTDANLKRIGDLESFKKEFEGKEFDKKVLSSLQDSSTIQKEIRNMAWQTIREKIVWIILGGLGLIITDLIIRAIPHILASIGGN